VTSEQRNLRVIIVAPFGRDAELMCTHLEAAGIHCQASENVQSACEAIKDGIGALILTEEALHPNTTPKLARTLDAQPPWSDIPIMILRGELSIEAKSRSFGELGQRTNVTLVDRPVRIRSLVSATQSALRARMRQYEIRNLMETLEDRINERDRFLAILGHELRNPLGAILLAAQMKDEDGKLDGDHAALIERQSKHLTRIVNDLLDLSRLVSGKILLKRQVLDLAEVVKQSVTTVHPAAQRQKIELDVQYADTPLPVDVDPVRADQIVTNVLTNAIKYTPEGGHVVVKLELDGDHAFVRVIDDGVGVASDRIGTIFELFAQAENAIGRAQGGMGIGLALVRNLLHLHGGSIDAKSDGVGKGSEFSICFPVAIPHSIASPDRRQHPRGTGDGEPRRIVIVEDNADLRELLRLKLKRLGHKVDAVGDGLSGLEKIVDVQPDLALVDIGLPGIDGYEVASRVRGTLGDGVVLVAVSGFGQPEDKRRAIEAGFDEHITKPADVTDIENLLARLPPKLAAEDAEAS